MIRQLAILFISILTCSTACPQGNRNGSPSNEGAPKVFTNPVIGQDGPDPTVLRDTDGTFWLYNTADLLSIWHSDDLVTWQRAG
ncbi:family 43 glycosylhydrolase, partial [Alistipes senegalensis]|uniref:family 43 glycosylhydrolase n=1 Tax=Alistipes senegalensis TaxID=1288121 RepID=UPI0018AA26C1